GGFHNEFTLCFFRSRRPRSFARRAQRSSLPSCSSCPFLVSKFTEFKAKGRRYPSPTFVLFVSFVAKHSRNSQGMKALVYKSTGSWYTVKDDAGNWHNARIKGVFKIDSITSTNPVAVGDEVDIEIEDEGENTAMITAIHPRRNYINRQSPRFKHQHHIVASNLDQSLLVATIKEPRTSQGFIDRFLVASEMFHVKALIVVNKADL